MSDEPTTTTTTTSSSQLLTVSSADILRLIQAHLIECGLHETAQTLQQESGVGLAGTPISPNQYYHWACEGQWALILESLAVIDAERSQSLDSSRRLAAQVHEMAILELAAQNEWDLAYALYRLVQRKLLEQHLVVTSNDSDKKKTKKNDSNNNNNNNNNMTMARLLEQKLAELASRRQKDPQAPLPADYYYGDNNNNNNTRQARREELGHALQDSIPQQPKNRLISLLQQAIKWQIHTGQQPQIKQWWPSDDGDEDGDTLKTNKKRKRKHFDLVLGESKVEPSTVGEERTQKEKAEPVPADPYSTIPFGKKATAEAALFLPDGSGLVTGSSDGLIEIWDPAQQFTQLRMDLPYQQKEELLGHDHAVTALAVSADGAMLASGSTTGQVQVVRLDTGKVLRQFNAHDAAVTHLAFSPDASHVLTASQNGTCREFGLRTARMLQEFRGHTTYLTSCFYQLTTWNDVELLLVVTASGDGTVRLFNARSSETLKVMRPVSLGKNNLSQVGSSIVIDAPQATSDTSAPAMHTVLQLHTPANTMILVPRGIRAFLVNEKGIVLQTYQSADSAKDIVFVAATVSPSNRSLYAVQENGVCCVFDIKSGAMLQTIPDFGSESTSRPKESGQAAEISAMIYHPHKFIMGAYSNDKGQKRGKLVLWK